MNRTNLFSPLARLGSSKVLFDADLCQLCRTSTTHLCFSFQLSSWLKNVLLTTFGNELEKDECPFWDVLPQKAQH